MLSFTESKKDCTGCTACKAACPVQCISMQSDKEGFIYPVSSDNCINCGLCERVCPIANPKVPSVYNNQKAYAFLTKDSKIWRRSASGGAFSEICKAWADNNTWIFGAAWNGLSVHHMGVAGFKNIAPLCKSKYVASNPEDTLCEVNMHLKSGHKVIYCGTPCQIAGLKAFLRKDYPNLLTIDIICHGVGSPKVFNEAVKTTGRQINIEIVGYEFRAKRKVHESDYIQKLISPHGCKYIVNDPYIQLFLSQLCLRPSCGENCKFRTKARQGDITIADFKGLHQIFPDLQYSKRNYSTIVSNTIKGDEIIPLLRKSGIIRETSIGNIIKYNPLFAHQTWFSNDRNTFFSEFEENPQTAIAKWTQPVEIFKPGFKQRLKNIIPSSSLKFIQHILKR